MDAEDEYFIIDTDCGTDDAVAIMMAINYIQNNANNKRLLAIICCTGNTTVDNVLRNVSLTLRIMKQEDVKVYQGSHCSLLNKYASRRYYSEDGLGNSVHYYDAIEARIEKENGVHAMISFVKKYPKKVTILCLGPLTNLALAHIMDKQFFQNTKELYILGGNINVSDYVDFNFDFDVEAADITLKNAVCPVFIIPLEVHRNCCIPWDFYKNLIAINNEKALFFKRITEYAVNNSVSHNDEGIKLADRLIVALYLNPKCVLSASVWNAEIELNSKLTRGQLVVNKSSTNHTGFTFITNIDTKAVNEMVKEMLM